GYSGDGDTSSDYDTDDSSDGDGDGDVDHDPILALRGPGYHVRKGTFEDRIFYGNHLLNEDRWDYLKSIVKQCQPPIPYYVSTVTRSAVIRGKSKMCFSKEYSRAYLKDYLRKPMVVRVIKRSCSRWARRMGERS
uniref:Uncharacterized protein n=1 Tax=Triticum urartu TaxID=4572 RepID=A0A8R7P0W2_TRIUA